MAAQPPPDNFNNFCHYYHHLQKPLALTGSGPLTGVQTDQRWWLVLHSGSVQRYKSLNFVHRADAEFWVVIEKQDFVGIGILIEVWKSRTLGSSRSVGIERVADWTLQGSGSAEIHQQVSRC